MVKKILLIRPANVYNYNNYPPLNLILLASALRNEGFETKILNSALEPDLKNTLKTLLPDTLFVAVTMLTPEVPDAITLMEFIRENSSVPIIVGGWHCTLFPDQMANSTLVDYVITGEGDLQIVELARKICAGELPERKVFERKILDMDRLPVPDYFLDPLIEKFINNYLTDALSVYVKQPMRWLPYESSRGCPSECTFCINVVTQNTRYRKKNAQKVIAEVEEIVKTHNLTHVKFIDDNFFVDIKRVREICQGLINRKLQITWDAECRCDYFNERLLNDETLELAKKAGLVQLTLGIESGSQSTLDLMKKRITPDQAETAIQKCNQFGIIARSSFMLEVPGESKKDILATIRFINRMRKYPWFSCGVGTFRPYPKCELTRDLIKKGYLTEPVDLKDWASQDLIDMYTAAEYIRPWQIDGGYSVSAAYYLNIESSTRLGKHQIDRLSDRLKNSLFIQVAKIRNRLMFYGFPIDMILYKRFLEMHYKKKGDSEKGVADNPLTATEKSEIL